MTQAKTNHILLLEADRLPVLRAISHPLKWTAISRGFEVEASKPSNKYFVINSHRKSNHTGTVEQLSR